MPVPAFHSASWQRQPVHLGYPLFLTLHCVKDFQRSPFLHEVLHAMLSGLFPHPADSLPDGVKNVLLVDASIVRQTGILQNQERIHLCYSLNQNRIVQIKVTDHHTAESLSHFELKAGDLAMADAG